MRSNEPFTEPIACGALVACHLSLDVFWPPDGASSTVVMIPGGPLAPGANRSSLWGLARLVASRGAVVFVAEYRSGPTYGGGLPATFDDVACAIVTARARAAEFGGTGTSVTLVAHSFGGFPGIVAVAPRSEFHGQGCRVVDGNPHPDGFVGIAGVYLPTHVSESFLEEFLGGSREDRAEAWRAVDARILIPGSPAVPAAIVTGGQDLVGRQEHAAELAAVFDDAGWPVERALVDGANHDSILVAPATVDAVVGVMER